jgi:hypothetical protein
MNTAVDITDPWADVADEYVVDGRDLLRVVSLPDRARGLRTAVLEDCRTLELRHCRMGKLRRLRRLRRVRGLRGSEPITGTG